MKTLREILAGGAGNGVDGRSAVYPESIGIDRLRAWQLDRFNAEWGHIRESVPFYAERRASLPVRFESWAQFRELMPVLDRAAMRDRREELTDPRRSPDEWRTTGGSTAEPLRVPVWSSEAAVPRRNMWLARSWFGVTRADRLFLLWGHSHLMGKGLRGRISAWDRYWRDRVRGYRRFSAYDLSDRRMRVAGEALAAFRPRYVMGYAVALDRMARANADRRQVFARLGLRVAIATAEAFPTPRSARLLSEVLGCPVAMEYGAVETGPLAHQGPDGRYRIFWRDYYLEGLPVANDDSRREIAVTCLYPRCLPLVRYRIGDVFSGRLDDQAAVAELHEVAGRCNDFVTLRDGSMIHSEAFSHALREAVDVAAFQVVQTGDGRVAVRYIAAEPLSPSAAAAIRSRLSRAHAGLAETRLMRVDALAQTSAGKTRMVVREDWAEQA